MESQSKVRIANYSFVITILWIGFILAIGFLETPLRFHAEGVTLAIALQIGHLVFHGLNYCELTFATLIIISLLATKSQRSCWRWFLVSAAILIIQTLLLFLVLDARTAAVIDNLDVGSSPVHSIYIGCEILKIVALALLAKCQITAFKQQILESR